MASINNTDALLHGISDDAPSGPDLGYDPAFMELERVARGAPQTRLVGPDTRSEAPDWRAIRDQAMLLLGRSKDLRVAAVLTKALLGTDGLAGLNDGTGLLLGLLTQFWDSVHPGISDDDGGPTMRVNVLKELLEPSVLAAVRAAPLVSVAALGSFSLRDVAMATGELVAAAGAGGTPPDMAKIDAAFGNCDLAQLQATAASARQALANIQGIERYVADKVGAQHGLDLEPLCGPLKRIDKLLGERLARREPALGSTNGTGGNGADGAHEARAVRGEIASRTDVVRVLDTLCAYYERHEPASPIPLLLRRAQRLVPMSFIEIVRELAPAGVSEIETIRGPQDSEKR